ncbi:hypothetical protein RvVAR0630_20440 [Agrobacterium vitis]|nr:hypothetical protein RvVAR0630_20440 [Agrobacterium vitis]
MGTKSALPLCYTCILRDFPNWDSTVKAVKLGKTIRNQHFGKLICITPLIVGDFLQTISGSILVNATEYDYLLDCKKRNLW